MGWVTVILVMTAVLVDESPDLKITSNRQFTGLVRRGEYPEQVRVPLDDPFVNQAGEIQNLLLEDFTSVALIHTRGGMVRANHYHKTDWHYAYVLSGEIHYFWRPVGVKDAKLQIFKPGSMFFTPPLVEHCMYFAEQTSFMTFARNVRDHEHHEEDVVRVRFVEVKSKLCQPENKIPYFVYTPMVVG